MTMPYKTNSYGTEKQILMFPDHKVAYGQIFKSNDAAAVTVNGRKILKAGTIYPTNDANAVGVIENTLDLTDGDRAGAILIHGFINSKKIPTKATTEAKAVLPLIKFMNEK